MIAVSKGDIVLEPIEFVIELLVRGGLRELLSSFPSQSVDQWGWPQWLWFLSMLVVLSLIMVALWRALGRNDK